MASMSCPILRSVSKCRSLEAAEMSCSGLHPGRYQGRSRQLADADQTTKSGPDGSSILVGTRGGPDSSLMDLWLRFSLSIRWKWWKESVCSVFISQFLCSLKATKGSQPCQSWCPAPHTRSGTNENLKKWKGGKNRCEPEKYDVEVKKFQFGVFLLQHWWSSFSSIEKFSVVHLRLSLLHHHK